MDKGFNGAAILFQSAKSVTPLGLKVLLGALGGFGVVLFSIGTLKKSQLLIRICISLLRVFVFGRLFVLCCVWELFVESKVTHWRT